VGPSSDSKRAATVRSLVGMLQFAQNDPEMSTVLTSMAMMNMEGEGLKDVRDFFRKRLVRMGAVEPNEEEMQEMEAELQNQKPDANAELLLAEADKSKSAAEVNRAKVENVQLDTALKAAQVGRTQMESEKLGADIDSQSKSDVISILDAVRGPAPRQNAEKG
jgi:Phage P22-like portal protein